jgi:hypothetical protein
VIVLDRTGACHGHACVAAGLPGRSIATVLQELA